MTTDITELAQRMKAAAVRTKAATEDYVAHRMSITVCLEECKEFDDLSDDPDNILALVEALEKAQTINAAAEKLVRCKGRYHSELNYRALAALFGVTTPDLPPIDGESRAVKLPVGYTASSGHPFNEAERTVMIPGGGDWLNRFDVEHVLTAAGIKLEAE